MKHLWPIITKLITIDEFVDVFSYEIVNNFFFFFYIKLVLYKDDLFYAVVTMSLQDLTNVNKFTHFSFFFWFVYYLWNIIAKPFIYYLFFTRKKHYCDKSTLSNNFNLTTKFK